METVRVKILRQTKVGKKTVLKNAVMDVAEDDAKSLFRLGKAEPADKEAKESKGDPATPKASRPHAPAGKGSPDPK